MGNDGDILLVLDCFWSMCRSLKIPCENYRYQPAGWRIEYEDWEAGF